MREDLALKHLLYTQARELSKLSSIKSNKEIEQGLKDLLESLVVEYQRQNQNYLIKVVINQQNISLTVDKKEFSFYQRADINKTENTQKLYQIGEDLAATNNEKKAREILVKFFLKANLPNNFFGETAKETKPTTKFDWLAWGAVFLIAIAASILTWYQGTKTFNLIDNTYTLEIAWRILQGEIPYKDFTLVVMPGVYLKQALLMKLFGSQAIVGLWWTMFAMALTVLLIHLILKLIDTPRWMAVGLCLIVLGGGHIVRPYIWYDVDTLLLCFVSYSLLLWSEKKYSLNKGIFFIGLLAFLPVIFKQNLGIAHLVIVSSIIYVQWVIFPNRFSWSKAILFHLGIFAGIAILMLPFLYLGAAKELIHNTFFLAAELRVGYNVLEFISFFKPIPPSYYYSNVENNPNLDLIPFFMGSFLLWGSSFLVLLFWFVGTHRKISYLLMPIWILGISLAGVYTVGTGSVPALVPLVVILIALFWGFVKHFPALSKSGFYLFLIFPFFLSYLAISYALSGRQMFFYKNAFVSPTSFKSERLKGMYSSPDVVESLDAIVSFVNNLPTEDTVALIPTEDPIYFLTNRKSPLNLVQRFRQTGGDPDTKYVFELERVKPTWIINKLSPQFNLWPPLTQLEFDWLKANYQALPSTNGYRIWKLKENARAKQ
ncbi:MAG: hypothetical protein WAQ98_17295 [Blastocatellia bacterium]